MPSAYAVVASGTPLAIAPRQGAPLLFPPRDASRAPAFLVFRILGQEDGWAALETLGDAPATHCAGGIAALEPFRLRLYVPASALVPVTQREIAQPFADGTRIELARGIPLEPLPQSFFRVHLGETSSVVRLGIADVGTRYLPSAELDRPSVDRALRADVLAAAVPVLGQTGRVESSSALPVYSAEPRGAEVLAELRPTCARVVVRVPSHAIVSTELAAPILASESAEPAAPILASERAEPAAPILASPPSSLPHVRAGAPVRWRDGTVAGVVSRDVTLDSESDEDTRWRCFVRALGNDADATSRVELCFDRHDVVEPGAGPAQRLDSPR